LRPYSVFDQRCHCRLDTPGGRGLPLYAPVDQAGNTVIAVCLDVTFQTPEANGSVGRCQLRHFRGNPVLEWEIGVVLPTGRRCIVFVVAVEIGWRCAGKHFDDMATEEQRAFAGIGIEGLQDRCRVKAGKPVWNVREKAVVAE